jgi:hypothetical protein
MLQYNTFGLRFLNVIDQAYYPHEIARYYSFIVDY